MIFAVKLKHVRKAFEDEDEGVGKSYFNLSLLDVCAMMGATNWRVFNK